MLDKIEKKMGKENIHTKKGHITVQSLNQRSFSKNHLVIVTGNDVKQMEPLRDTTERKEGKKKEKKREKKEEIKKMQKKEKRRKR